MEAFNKPSGLSLTGNIAENWRKFHQQFKIYLRASDKEGSSDQTKVAVLLNLVGEDAIELFNTFALTDSDFKKLARVVKAFEDYCIPRKNIIYERYQFWQCMQDDCEKVDQFVMRIRTLVKTCEYNDRDEMIRDKLVFGIKDDATKQKLLSREDLQLKQAIDIARAAEVSKSQTQMMATQSKKVNLIRNQNQQNRPRQQRQTGEAYQFQLCQYCNRKHAKRACPAFGKTCGYCQKVGHFVEVCRTKKRDEKNLHLIEESQADDNQSESSANDLTVLNIYSAPQIHNHHQNNWTVSLKINQQLGNFKIDSGADCNVMSMNLFNTLKLQTKDIIKSKSRLKVYNGSKIHPIGKISVTVEYRAKYSVAEFLVVEQNLPNILGLPSCLDLGLIQRVYATEQENIEDKYKEVFNGLGDISGIQHRIKLNKEVEPVVHPPRKVPVALRKSLQEELQRMEALDVITKTTEPTEWVNSLVIARKKNGKIRVCMDPSSLNKAIRREHYPMRTIEEVISQMPNAKIFSVLDANHGFWQVKLTPESTKLCTFNTPFGRYSFKRLPFGITSAPEVFQRVTTELFEGKPESK